MAASVFVATRATSVSVFRGSAMHSVAVFPFAVSGDGKLNFLRVGMVDLLSTSLDGVAELQTIDPRVVLAAASTAGSSASASPGLVIAAARRLGASQVVLGTVVGAGGRIIVNARLYLVSDSIRPIAHASASGSEADLFAVVDQIAGQLAVGRGAASHDRCPGADLE